jgi:hypothetical protein
MSTHHCPARVPVWREHIIAIDRSMATAWLEQMTTGT